MTIKDNLRQQAPGFYVRLVNAFGDLTWLDNQSYVHFIDPTFAGLENFSEEDRKSTLLKRIVLTNTDNLPAYSDVLLQTLFGNVYIGKTDPTDELISIDDAAVVRISGEINKIYTIGQIKIANPVL